MNKKCTTCAKTVYLNEKIEYDGNVFHEECFICVSCRSRVTARAVASINNTIYCKPCFKKMFKEKGSYAVFGAKGEGKDAGTLAATAAAADSSPAITSPVSTSTTSAPKITSTPAHTVSTSTDAPIGASTERRRISILDKVKAWENQDPAREASKSQIRPTGKEMARESTKQYEHEHPKPQVNGAANSANGPANSVNGAANSVNGAANSVNGAANSVNGAANSVNAVNGAASNVNDSAQNGVSHSKNEEELAALKALVQQKDAKLQEQSDEIERQGLEIKQLRNQIFFLSTSADPDHD